MHFIRRRPKRRNCGCKVEVQIRSVLQHAWAAVEHELAYKNQQAKRYELCRSFSLGTHVLYGHPRHFSCWQRFIAQAKQWHWRRREKIETAQALQGEAQAAAMVAVCAGTDAQP